MSEYTEDFVNRMIDNWFESPYTNQSKSYKSPRKEKPMAQISIGDQVKLKYGRSPMTVESVTGRLVYARYNHSNQLISRRESEFVPYTDNQNNTEQGNQSMKGKLFQTKDDNRFGVGLAINSKGEYVLEMKGSGDLEAFDKDSVEIVMPFTFAVRFSTSNTEYQYLGKEGSVEPGDLLLAFESNHKKGGISIAQVTRVNTKSERATKHFSGVKVKTEPLEAD
jgi:hypothetical protein